jgi:hypothetical protein
MHVTRKRVILTLAVVAIVTVTAAIFWPTKKAVFLKTAEGRYRVIKAHAASGTNLFANPAPVNDWLCRRLAFVGVRLKSARRDSPFAAGVRVNAISVLCEGANSSEDMLLTDCEYVDDLGRTVPLNHRGRFQIADNRVQFVWYYTDSELTNLHKFGKTDFDVANFRPQQLVLRRKSDHRELTRLDLSE